jgi:ubiquitin
VVAQASPAATSQTKANNAGGVTTVSVTPKRKITYVFNATSSANLSIPFALAIDGSVLAAYADKPKRVLGAGGKIEVMVDQGQKVSLFLNSDAHPDYRKSAVYAVIAGERNAVVRITEKSGKHPDADTPVKQSDKDPKVEAAKAEDTYAALLTGDIWMKVSHKYASSEVDALVPAETTAEVTAAVKSIYDGLGAATLKIAVAAKVGQPARALDVKFEDSANPKSNIVSYSLLTDGLTRVHPAGYAALFNSALDNSITSLNVTSCWRPMLGSIAHRAGLGLDVNFVGGTRMNRQELRNAFDGKKPARKGDGNDTDNVSDAEVTTFGAYEDSIVAGKRIRTEQTAAKQALDAAKKTNNAAKVTAAQVRSDTATQAAKDASDDELQARDAWNKARNVAEPADARLFRASLLKCICVRQLFDPWFMDENTQDATAPAPNMQRGSSTSNERLHSHHLHVTVHEPKIL